MSLLLFLPWYETREGRIVAGFELLPYRRGQCPLDGESQAHIDLVLNCYQDAGGHPTSRATVLRVGSHDALDDLSDEEQDAAVEFVQALTTAGLAGRRYFEQLGYCSADTFSLVMQRFSGTPDHIAPRTRRRDGSNTNLWPADGYRVVRPVHVASNLGLRVDWALLESLLSARTGGNADVYFDSCVGYNLANSDSDRVSLHSELVLLVGALQRVLQCKTSGESEFVEALQSALHPSADVAPLSRARIAGHDGLRVRHARDKTLREAWAKDLYRSRGNPAHGKLTHGYQPSWSVEEHLLLGSFLFPRLLKQELARAGHYTLTRTDLAELDKFEALAAADHFVGETDNGWPWPRILAGERPA